MAKREKPKAGAVPIETCGFSERMQVDLIDLRSTDCQRYKWLLTLQDHGVKYCKLVPLVNKTSRGVAWALYNVFSDIGAPSIIQTDNGKEFSKLDKKADKKLHIVNINVEEVIKELNQIAPSMKCIHGRARHSQSQGGVERLNQTVQSHLTKCLEQNGTAYWPVFVPFVQYLINNHWQSSIKGTAVAHCLLLVAHCSLLIARCSLLVAHCSLLIADCGLRIVDC